MRGVRQKVLQKVWKIYEKEEEERERERERKERKGRKEGTNPQEGVPAEAKRLCLKRSSKSDNYC